VPVLTRSQAISRASRYAGSLNESVSVGILQKSSQEFSESDQYDIFLSHSYADAREILGVALVLGDYGFSAYIDWVDDSQLDRSDVTKSTVLRIKQRMQTCSSLFYVASENAPNSKWMPWELGYVDGLKNRVAVLPLLNTPEHSYRGREYLGVYPYVIQNRSKKGDWKLWVKETPTRYVVLSAWLRGENPTER
jgi:hypothetical protein